MVRSISHTFLCVSLRVQLSCMSSSLTSTLLWVSPAPTVSPLHYDLSEGVLAQLHGTKRITLAATKYNKELYPYPLAHAHDRQSQVDNIHDPDARAFPLSRSVPLLSGDLDAGSLLYIPYGWWHQIESIDTAISISMRWNPYEEALRQAAAAAGGTRMLPPAARTLIQQQLFTQLGVPDVVRDINLRRWDELAAQTANATAAAMLAVST